LAWFDVTDIYLARGFAMHKTGKLAATTLRFSPTLPWDRVLAMITDSMAASGSPKLFRQRVRMTLSGVLCPAVALAAPKGASGWTDLQQILPASAAASLATEASHLRCALENSGELLGAAMGTSIHQSITKWASEQRFRLESIAPSWAIATQCKAIQRTHVHALEIEEADGTTLLTKNPEGWASISLAHGLDSGATPMNSALVSRHKVSMGVEEASLQKLKLHTAAGVRQAGAPRQWRDHWSFS
jgi:hypothetical protein